ncbi:hypothetical protein NKH89_30825 [Mesorhizobium sp. M0923]|uniref:hypothetical protein n=1 Tax=unclassified Mesorhizobium TaxID=325217 RepID=UPI003337A83C
MALFDWFQAPKRMALFGGFWTRAPGDSTRQISFSGHVTFVVQGIRFCKDGTLGKLHETLTLSFKDEGKRREEVGGRSKV